ncbi:unnamed protein product [Absidia cylindrospora]
MTNASGGILDKPSTYISYRIKKKQTMDESLLVCALVNYQFYQASIKYIWHTIHLKRQGKGISFLQRLVFTMHPDDPIGNHIRSVHLHGVRWTDKTLLGLMKRSRHLESITIDDGRRVSDENIKHISRYWPHLKSLHLSSSPITDVSYKAIGQCPTLVKLTLDRCPLLQHNTFVNHFSDSPLQDLVLTIGDHDELDLSALVHLTQLTIHGHPTGILQRAVAAAENGVSCWPRLTSISMGECFNMMDDDLLPLLRLVPGVTHITLKNGNFSDAVLNAIARYNPNLIELDISYNNQFTTQGIHRLVKRCLCLKWLTLITTLEEINHHHQHCSSSDNTRMALHHLDSRALDILRHGDDMMLTWGIE